MCQRLRTDIALANLSADHARHMLERMARKRLSAGRKSDCEDDRAGSHDENVKSLYDDHRLAMAIIGSALQSQIASDSVAVTCLAYSSGATRPRDPRTHGTDRAHFAPLLIHVLAGSSLGCRSLAGSRRLMLHRLPMAFRVGMFMLVAEQHVGGLLLFVGKRRV